MGLYIMKYGNLLNALCRVAMPVINKSLLEKESFMNVPEPIPNQMDIIFKIRTLCFKIHVSTDK